MAKQRADALVARGLDAASPWGIRLASAWFIAAAGLAAVVVPLARAVGTGRVTAPLLGTVVPMTFGLIILASGYWLAKSDFDGELAVAVAVWWFLGTAFGAFSALGLVGYQLSAGVQLADIAVVVSGLASVGGIGGLLVGRYDAQSQQRRRELEAERKQLADEREKLALLNRIVRHDIGNDLQIISGMTGHLESYVEDGGEEYFGRVQRTTEEAIQLTEQVRAFVASLGEDNRSTGRRISLERVLETQIDNAREVYRRATIVVDDELPDVAIPADELLSTIFHNLLTNAVEHNDRENPSVEVLVETSDGKVTVSVADNGPGIPPAERAAALNPDDHEVDDQSGLGLYIVGMLVDRYGGSISFADRDPTGTVVTVQLPVADGDTE
ncbi:sensor histidine kinase [Halorhabdus salina]|uniref:sensor histidine kinase n=1 Tax=Halorhabdus salina TaxID=2750670 RepID=UPI0015EFC4DC|nr:HAMP domain-containing sensor histidine kinase [Halorhabdus salina]